MTEHKFTDDEIIEGLNAYVSRMCNKCNVKDLGTCCGSCFITVISQSTNLINRQRAEIERLKKLSDEGAECPTCHGVGKIGTTNWITKDLSKKQIAEEKAEAVAEFHRELKAEAIKEFAERLKERLERKYTIYGREYVLRHLRELVKEMTEEQNE